jgi:enolase
MSVIKDIEARKILDSRGRETIEVKVSTDTGVMVTDSVPSGTSTGSSEAFVVEPSIAVSNVNNLIRPQIIGMNPAEQGKIDQTMLALDGTQNKSKLGANAILGVSLAVSRAAAGVAHMPLYSYLNVIFNQISGLDIKPSIPTPMMVMIEGGQHAVDSKTNIQEFLCLCSLENGGKIWNRLKKNLAHDDYGLKLGLEGGFTPKLEYDEDALRLIIDAVEQEGLTIPEDVKLGLDITGNYCQMTTDDVISLMERYPLYSIEDPFAEDEWSKWTELKLALDQMKKDYLLVGDDLFTTNMQRFQKGASDFAANGMIIKINQVGTLTETLSVIAMTQKAKFTHILSHRSGETMDTYISDLAVATGSKYLKSGAPFATERVIKYNRLKEIAEELTR